MYKQSAITVCPSLRLSWFLVLAFTGSFCLARHIPGNARLPLTQIAANQEKTYSDESIIASTLSVLKTMNVDVLKIEIVNNRSNNGERVMIINCAHCSGSENDHLRELVKILQSGDAVNKSFQSGIDIVTAVIGDRQGRVCAVITVKSSDSEQYVKTKDVYAYLSKWTVAIFKPDFLPQTSAVMHW